MQLPDFAAGQAARLHELAKGAGSLMVAVQLFRIESRKDFRSKDSPIALSSHLFIALCIAA